MTPLSELKRLAEEAKGSPWTVLHNSWEFSTVYDEHQSPIATVQINNLVTEETQDIYEPLKDAQAAFIAAANPAVLIELIERVEKAEAALTEIARHGDGFGPHDPPNHYAGTTGEGHAWCRERAGAALTMVGGMGDQEYEFEVWQDDQPVAWVNCLSLFAAAREASRYAAVYQQDGPVEVKRVERTVVTAEQLQGWALDASNPPSGEAHDQD